MKNKMLDGRTVEAPLRQAVDVGRLHGRKTSPVWRIGTGLLALSLTLSNLRCAVDGDKVQKIMVLRLNAKHIPEGREVTSQLAKQREEQAAFREKSKGCVVCTCLARY